MVSANFPLLLTLFSLLTLEVTAADKSVSIELEGTFSSDFGNYKSEVDTHAGFNFNVPHKNGRSKRENREIPPGYFTGKLTYNSNNEKLVIGVNSTFEYVLLDPEVREVESNRVTREASNKTRVGLYAQLALGRSSDVLRIRINWDIEELSTNLDPYIGTSTGSFGPKVEFGFKGALTATKGGSESDVINFAVNFGFQDKSRPINNFVDDNDDYDEFVRNATRNRRKRNEPRETLKFIGEWTTKQTMRTGSILTSIDAIDGEAVVDFTKDEGPTPATEFFADANANQFLIETNGNITETVDGSLLFNYPIGTSMRFNWKDKRTQRDVSGDDSVVGLEYNGVVSTVSSRNRGRIDKLGVSSRSTLWLISRERRQ